MFSTDFFANQKTNSHFAKITLQFSPICTQITAFFAAYPLQPFIGNLAKKRLMMNRSKATVSLLSLIMSASFFVAATQAQAPSDRLQVYAGPQTALPGDNINVTIEMTDSHGNSEQGETIQLTYISDGVPMRVSGKVSNGLVSFDVKAQRKAGGMTFQALSGDLVSNNAPVLIVAAQPNTFKLKVRPSRNANFVEIRTETLSDTFGNLISDQNLMNLSWIDSSGVKRSEAVQLSNGSLSYVSICPRAYVAPLKIRAVLKNVEVFSSDLSVLCPTEKEAA